MKQKKDSNPEMNTGRKSLQKKDKHKKKKKKKEMVARLGRAWAEPRACGIEKKSC